MKLRKFGAAGIASAVLSYGAATDSADATPSSEDAAEACKDSSGSVTVRAGTSGYVDPGPYLYARLWMTGIEYEPASYRLILYNAASAPFFDAWFESSAGYKSSPSPQLISGARVYNHSGWTNHTFHWYARCK